MPAFCVVPSLQGPIAQGLADFVDCQSKALGEIGYRTLAAPDSSVGMLLVGLLTIFIALIGFRLLLGETPTLERVVRDTLRVGIALTLATSWSAYHVLIYDVAIQTPITLAAEISQPMGFPGADGSLLARLQDVADALARSGGTPGASLTFLVSSLGALLATRAVTGLLLALGPLVATFLLFDATRGLFEGWLRALLAMVLATFTTLVLLGFELSVIEPILNELTQARQSGTIVANGNEWPAAIATLFGLVILAGLIAAFKIASGFRFPSGWARPAPISLGMSNSSRILAPAGLPGDFGLGGERARARVIGDALVASIRREERSSENSAASSVGRRDVKVLERGSQTIGSQPLGQTARRGAGTRVSAAATKRSSAT